MNATRLLVAEPTLRYPGGHEARDALAIARAASDLGLSVTVLGHRDVQPDILELFERHGIELRPVFDLEERFDLPMKLMKWGVRSLRYYQGLVRAGISDDSATVLLTNEGRDDFLPGAIAHAFLGKGAYHHVFQLFGWDGWVRDLSGSETRVLLDAIRRWSFGATRHLENAIRRVTIAGQTGAVARRIREETDTDTMALPLPIDWSEYGPIPTSTNGPPKIGYLGDTRAPKGFDLFAGAVGQLRHPHQVETHALVLTASGAERRRQEQLVRELASEPANVVHTELLSPKDYLELLKRLDIVVLPYRAASYRTRGSRIFAEALGMGKVVVTNRSISLGDFVEQQRVGTTFGAETPEALARAIDEALSGFESLSSKSHEHAPGYRRRHSNHELVRRLARLKA